MMSVQGKTSAIRVVVVESNPEYRELLAEQIRLAPDLEVVGEARDGREAIVAVGRLDPDVLALDMDLPGMPGLEILRMVTWYSPRTKVILLSGQREEATVLEALTQGAKGFIVKGDGTDLAKAIRAVHGGEVWARRRMMALVFEELVRLINPQFSTTASEPALS